MDDDTPLWLLRTRKNCLQKSTETLQTWGDLGLARPTQFLEHFCPRSLLGINNLYNLALIKTDHYDFI